MTFLLLNYVTKSAVFTRPFEMCQSVINFQRHTKKLRFSKTYDYINRPINRIFTKYDLLDRRAIAAQNEVNIAATDHVLISFLSLLSIHAPKLEIIVIWDGHLSFPPCYRIVVLTF